jgi:hypothetical protein
LSGSQWLAFLIHLIQPATLWIAISSLIVAAFGVIHAFTSSLLADKRSKEQLSIGAHAAASRDTLGIAERHGSKPSEFD